MPSPRSQLATIHARRRTHVGKVRATGMPCLTMNTSAHHQASAIAVLSPRSQLAMIHARHRTHVGKTRATRVPSLTMKMSALACALSQTQAAHHQQANAIAVPFPRSQLARRQTHAGQTHVGRVRATGMPCLSAAGRSRPSAVQALNALRVPPAIKTKFDRLEETLRASRMSKVCKAHMR